MPWQYAAASSEGGGSANACRFRSIKGAFQPPLLPKARRSPEPTERLGVHRPYKPLREPRRLVVLGILHDSSRKLAEGISMWAHELARVFHRLRKLRVVRRELLPIRRLDGEELVPVFHIQIFQGRSGENHTERVPNFADFQCVGHAGRFDDRRTVLPKLTTPPSGYRIPSGPTRTPSTEYPWSNEFRTFPFHSVPPYGSLFSGLVSSTSRASASSSAHLRITPLCSYRMRPCLSIRYVRGTASPGK